MDLPTLALVVTALLFGAAILYGALELTNS